MMFPVFRLQGDMQERIIGRSFWKKLTKRRNAVDEFQSIDLSTLLASVAADDPLAGMPVVRKSDASVARKAKAKRARGGKGGRWSGAAPLDARKLRAEENSRRGGPKKWKQLEREHSGVADDARALYEKERRERKREKRKKKLKKKLKSKSGTSSPSKVHPSQPR